MRRRAAAMLLGAAALGIAAGGWTWRSHMGGAPEAWKEQATMAKRTILRPALFAAAALGGSASAAVPPTSIGIHVSSVGARAFANIAAGGGWAYVPPGGPWSDMPKNLLSPSGEINSLPAGGEFKHGLLHPHITGDSVRIRCTYTGKGAVSVGGYPVVGPFPGKGGFTFDWRRMTPPQGATINITAMDPANPIRDIDCREKDIPPTALFYPQLTDLLRGFKVLRFMDWQNTNNNPPSIRWATRHTPGSGNIADGDGVPIETMVALANQMNADAWFNMPWNADDDYIEHFAHYVHDHLAPGRQVYVETSNEVWNEAFPVAQQAIKEGLEEKLSTEPGQAKMFRYAERSIHVLDIWKRVYADAPRRLVRVFSAQAETPFFTDPILKFRDTPRHFDALASAPYFSYDNKGSPTSLDEIFSRISVGVDHALGLAADNKAVAIKYGLRYVAYEAGQSIRLDNVALAKRIQTDPRMHDMYKRYLDGWRTRIGDTIIMFGTVYETGTFGSWGLVENYDDTEATAPKLRAVREELRAGSD